VGARYSAFIQTSPGAHPASYKMGTGSFPSIKHGRGMVLTNHPHLAEVKDKVELNLYPPLGFHGLF